LRTKKPGSGLEGGQVKNSSQGQYPRLRVSENDLALTLLEAGVLLVDNVELTVATDDFAINATFLHRGFYFHDLEENEKNLLVTILNAALRQVIGRHFKLYLVAGQNLDIVHPHLTRDVGNQLVAIFQFHAKHGVRKGF
jgi:hypothetical protein